MVARAEGGDVKIAGPYSRGRDSCLVCSARGEQAWSCPRGSTAWGNAVTECGSGHQRTSPAALSRGLTGWWKCTVGSPEDWHRVVGGDAQDGPPLPRMSSRTEWGEKSCAAGTQPSVAMREPQGCIDHTRSLLGNGASENHPLGEEEFPTSWLWLVW